LHLRIYRSDFQLNPLRLCHGVMWWNSLHKVSQGAGACGAGNREKSTDKKILNWEEEDQSIDYSCLQHVFMIISQYCNVKI
jgi:hypothetical protein